MSFKLLAPGRRKGNQFWLARGYVGTKRYEFSTGTKSKDAAERIAAAAWLKIFESRGADAKERLTFRSAAKTYESWREASVLQSARIAKLCSYMGDRAVDTIQHEDLVAAANALYPKSKASTRNRCVITIAGAILHYAANNGLCAYRRFPRFKEPKPVTRAVAIADVGKLVEASSGPARLLLIVLFGLGQRISDTLRIKWDDIDLKARSIAMKIGKRGGEARTFPLPDQVFEALASTDKDTRTGYLLPWRSRTGARKALRSATAASKVRFTPHMARHTLGTLLNASGAGLKTIMATLGHSDAKSSLRYQDADIDIVRAAHKKLGRFLPNGGKIGGKRKKAV